MKLKAGDYVSMKGMTEDEYNAVAKAFIKSGAGIGEYAHGMQKFPFFGWGPISGQLYHGRGSFQLVSGKSQEGCRELSVEQVIGCQEWNGEGLPPIGCEARCIDGIPSRNKVFSGTIVKVISNCKDADGDDVTVGHHRDIGYVVLQSRGFVPVKTEAQRLSEAASIKLKTAQKVIDAGYRKESV